MKTKLIVLLTSVGFLFCFENAFAKTKIHVKASSMCAPCHGAKGVSSNGQWPNLAGQKKEYLKNQLLAYKSGKRKDPTHMMDSIAKQKSFTKKLIDALATYYSELK